MHGVACMQPDTQAVSIRQGKKALIKPVDALTLLTKRLCIPRCKLPSLAVPVPIQTKYCRPKSTIWKCSAPSPGGCSENARTRTDGEHSDCPSGELEEACGSGTALTAEASILVAAAAVHYTFASIYMVSGRRRRECSTARSQYAMLQWRCTPIQEAQLASVCTGRCWRKCVPVLLLTRAPHMVIINHNVLQHSA